MRRLTILNVAYPFAPVGPGAVGGAEQVLSQLDAALMHAGHRSIVLAAAGSIVAGEHISIAGPDGNLTADARRATQSAYAHTIAHVLEELPIEVIHMHGVDCMDYLPPIGAPTLVTLHLPPSHYPSEMFTIDRPHLHLNCVSERQRCACPPSKRMLPTITNGVSPERFDIRLKRRGFALIMGRICPEKNFHVALDAAAQAGVPALLAGKVFPYAAHREYFEREIMPRLDAQRRFVGAAGLRRKVRLLASAKCVLVPSLVAETSSLVAMEAIACGTPVIAFPAGSLPETVEHGRAGFIVNDQQAMAEAIHATDAINPDSCRRIARERFSLERTVAQYFDVYQRIASISARGRNRRQSRESVDVAAHASRFEIRDCSSPSTARESTFTNGAHRHSALTIEEITSLDALERFAPEWTELWTRAVRTTPFQSPQWLIPWWRQFGRGALWIIAVRDRRDGGVGDDDVAGAGGLTRAGRGELVGLAPLAISSDSGDFHHRDDVHDEDAATAPARRTISLIGGGISDYLDALFAPGYEFTGAEAIFRHLDHHRQHWDALDFHQLPEWSALRVHPAPPGYDERIADGEPCTVLELPPNLAELDGAIPGRLIKRCRYEWRKLERVSGGELRFRSAPPESPLEMFEALVRVHGARWSARGEPGGVLASPAVIAFHREALPRLLQLDAVRFHSLEVRGRAVAVLYTLCGPPTRERHVVSFYLTGFDPEFERHSVGSQIFWRAIEEAIHQGACAIDFLRGRERYKYRWGARDTPTFQRRLARVGCINAAAPEQAAAPDNNFAASQRSTALALARATAPTGY